MSQLYFMYASMNAGKSTHLLTSANNYKERGMGTLLLKPAADTRDSEVKIVSRLGVERDANVIAPDADVFEFFKWAQVQRDIHCVFVDEAQFLSREQVLQLAHIVDFYDCPVMCYGLRTDFLGRMFEGSQALMAYADKLVELKGVCHCGRKATMVARIDQNGDPITSGDQVFMGGNDRYISLCRKHYFDFTGLAQVKLTTTNV